MTIAEKTLLPGLQFFKHRSHAPYQVLRHVPPGLMVDIGAASGHTASMMVRMSPESTVHAFEPFPGNHRCFVDHVEGDPRIKLDKRAVSDRAGKARFVIPGIVSGNEPGWESMAGYSSLGLLGAPKAGETAITVETCRLDEVIFDHIRFMKIDTQGAELKVLRGCERLLDENKIDVIQIEYMGEEDVLAFVLERDFALIDTECILANRPDADLSDWEIVRESSLSTGKKVLVAWPRAHLSDPHEYATFLRSEKKRLGSLWTDLICVSQSFLPYFMFAAGKRDQEVAPDFSFSMRHKPNVPAI